MIDKKCWYDLGINATQLIISIRKDAWEDIVGKIAKYGWIPKMEELTQEKWNPPSESLPTTFGFGENNQFTAEQASGEVVCTADFPSAETSAQPFACTLKNIFNQLWLFGYDSEPNVSHEESASLVRPQLLTIEDIVFYPRKIRGDFGLSTVILSPLARWIAAYDKHGQTRYIHPEITETMQNIAVHIYGPGWFAEKFRQHALQECCCEFSDYSGVYFHCEGDRCDLGHGGAHNSCSDPWPYTIGPHNCDCFRQQFVLFAGVAKLCEVARQGINETRAAHQ